MPSAAENPAAETDTVYASPEAAGGTSSAPDGWWERYFVATDGLSDTAREVLDIDSSYIVDRGVFGAGEPGDERWPASRVRRGLVMGSVQSGKTASMLGAAAIGLDRGLDIVVVLAGTRLSLWQQTMERLEDQLDADTGGVARSRRRILVPTEATADGMSTTERYRMTSARVRRALDRRMPVIVVALKHARHIQEVRNELVRTVFPEVANLDRPVHMLVIDDEADDGSVLDAAVEAGLNPMWANLKQIPRVIADLWSPPAQATPENFYATYVGYTATPQANFLQDESNPLFPSDFLVALRTPLDRGELVPRSSTYTEPRGLPYFYTGGEVYYRRGRDANLCIPTTGVPDTDLGAALRAYLVAAAIRIHREQDRLGPATSTRTSFTSREDVKARAAKPHSMLVHPSAIKGEHFTAAEDILLWAGATSRDAARAQIESDSDRANLPAALAARIDQEEPLWSQWVDTFRASAQTIHQEFNTTAVAPIPDWPLIKDILLAEVIPSTRVSVINSDPDADDRPEYEPVQNDDGSWSAGRDVSTIFVSGNVMSRGLTLEGLSTTLFLRSSDRPLADTQMQMQRWFGYRGSYVELCRVFASEDQIEFFAHYHENDEAIRAVIAAGMNAEGAAPTPIVLQGDGYTATGKIANLGIAPLYPKRKPFITVVNDGTNPDPNEQVVLDLFTGAATSSVASATHTFGLILDQPLTLAQAADVLDRLSYNRYRPGTDNWRGELWRQIQDRVNAVHPLPAGTTLYRPTLPGPGQLADEARKNCPYTIAAYLRLWDACLTRHVRGLFDTGARNAPWPVVDLHRKNETQPRFWVGIRYGAGPIATGALATLSVPATRKALTAEGDIDGTWGANTPTARGTDFRGDEYFDYFHRGEEPPRALPGEEPFRPPGADGQILFYVNQRDGQPHPSIAVGVCVPLGGPDQFAAYV
jgi:hypothetical protein